jgi:two-component system C4-dicarboxylate transport response regulator DctD
METYFPTDSGRDVLVLLIEDENVSRRALGKLLAAQGYTTETVATAEEALAVLSVGQKPAVALVDLDLPGMSGAELLTHLNHQDRSIKTVLVTAASEERISRVMGGRRVSYIRKPIDFNLLLQTLAEKASTN